MMQPLNPIAVELNELMKNLSPVVYSLFSDLGKRIYLPKGILRQSAEVQEKADSLNATRAIAIKDNQLMSLDVLRQLIPDLSVESAFAYPPILGNTELRTLWQAHIRKENPLLENIEFNLPVVTSGMTQGFSILADLFVNSGDKLILPDMIWGNYRLLFETKMGAEVSTYTFFNTVKKFNIDGFKRTLLEHTDEKLLILLNFPHNPTGYSITETEASEIVESIVDCADCGCNILVMVDDAYAGFWYDSEVMHESIFSKLVGCHPNVVPVKIDGATKEEYAWGLRVGFLTFAFKDQVMSGIEEKLSGIIRTNTSGAAQLSQSIILKAMKSSNYEEEKRKNYEILKTRAEKAKLIATNKKYAGLWEVYPSHAGYFICLNLRLSNAEKVRQALLHEYGIGTISLGERDLRIAYSCLEEDEIEEVISAIAQIVQSHKIEYSVNL
ncbi:aminotransferase class I/II-fold pyridoxal phosphate-dependent enzyme [Candidatus Poribacteria bacterium]|nr:aminotransferase class I/II-fold pyridoxal phosphate-dependent enzyme [Candidatus Poribacteria bacterium]